MKKKCLLLIIWLMRMSIFGLALNLMTLGLLMANEGDAQKVPNIKDVYVSIDLVDVQLRDIFRDIELKTPYKFSFEIKDLGKRERFTLRRKNISVKNLLYQISKDSGLNFKQVNWVINVSSNDVDFDNGLETKSNLYYQAVTVTGQVLSTEDGQGLPGVNVIIKGTAKGTVTDIDGSYKIDVPDENAILVFSSVGYVQQERTVGNESVVNIKLQPNLTALEEIVVVGYGSQKKGELTSSISTVSGENIKEQNVQRIDQALQGQAAGVQVVNSSGRPGAPAIIRVRGSSTINDNSPLYVVDGVQTDNIENINPNDIESINILKDAGATIYGAQAANGVIIITTKTGKQGPPKISVDLTYGLQKIRKIPEFMNTEQFTRTYNAARAADGLSLYWDLNNLPPHDTKWIDQMFQTAPMMNHNVSLSGGSENTNYLLGINYMNQDGIMKTSGFERYNLRFNSDSKVGKKIRIGNTLTIGQENIKIPGGSEGGNELFITALRAAPTIPIYWTEWDAENNPLFESRGWKVGEYAGPSSAGEHPGSKNVVGFINEHKFDRQNRNLRIFGTLYGEYEPIENLVFRTQFGGDLGYDKDNGFNRSYSYGTKSAATASLNDMMTNTFFYSWDNDVKYNFSLQDAHNFSALLGMSARRKYSEFMQVRMNNYVDEDLQTISAGTTIGGVDGNNTEDMWISYFGRLNYDYQGKYLLQGIFRADGSSKFGTNNRFGYFPSVSGAWRLSQEDFWKSKIFNEIKLRGSWGMTGNDRIPAYGYSETLDFNGYVFGPSQQFVQGIYPASIANPDLKWETVILTDFGVDLGVFDSRLTLTIDWFNKETQDMLLQKPITASSGYATKPWYNAGSMKTTGWDFDIGYNNTFGDWRLNVSANISTYTNEVLELGADNEIVNEPLKTEVGKPIGYFYGYVTDGLFQNQEEINSHAFQSAGTQPGDIRFKDLNGDNKIDNLDRTMIGNPFPDMVFGFNASVAYKGFDLSMITSGTVGNEIFRYPSFGGFEGAINRYNGFSWVADYWSPDNMHNDVLRPRATFSDPNDNTRVSDRFVSNGTYLRLNNIQIGYTFNKGGIEKIGFESLRIYLSGQNLLTLTNYLAFDPEVGGENYTGLFGVDMFTQYPPARILTLGVKFEL